MLLKNLPLRDPGSTNSGGPDLRSASRYMRWLGWQQRRVLALGVLWGVVWMGTQAVVPGFVGAGVQAASKHQVSGVIWCALAVLGLGIIQAISSVLRHQKAVENWLTAGSRTQQLVARHASYLGADLTSQVATGEVVAVTANDVEKIGGAFDVSARFAGAIVSFVAVGCALVFVSAPMGAMVLIGVPLLSLFIGPVLRPLERRQREQRARLGYATSLAADTVAGLRVLRGIGGEDLFLDRFRTASQSVREAAGHTARLRSTLDALQVGLPGIFVVAVTWWGAHLALDGQLTIGQLVAFYGWTAFLAMPLRTITEAANKWTAAGVAARRVVRVLTLERARPNDATLALSFGDQPPAVHDEASGLDVPAGQLVAIISNDPDASGELANRLGGFTPVGALGPGVRLDATDIHDLSTLSLRRSVLVQDKDPVLLSGTLRQHFDVPRTGLIDPMAAVQTAQAMDVLDALRDSSERDSSDGADDVMDSRIAERGRSLSGGQKQRLALARSLVVDAPLLVLDEPTSAVDAHTESQIAQRLRDARAGRTTIIFTTSPLILEAADQVAWLRNGRIVIQGNHRTLMHEDHAYRAAVSRAEGES